MNWDINTRTNVALSASNYLLFFLFKKNIIDNFPIINNSNKSFIISILYSSIVSKFSPKNKPNKRTPQATTTLMLINYFLKIVNNS